MTAVLWVGQAATQIDITSPVDFVQGVPNDGDWPGNEAPPLAIDDGTNTKFLHFKGASQPAGFQVTPSIGPTVVTGLTFTTANDAPERDPIAFELAGSNMSVDGPYTAIVSGEIEGFAGATSWPRLTKTTTPITFANTQAYSHYQLLFPRVRDAASANSMQIAEVEFLGSVAAVPPPDGNPGEPGTGSEDALLVISEFQALNEAGFSTTVEGKAVYPDWIEIHNLGAKPANLSGWHLTDDIDNLTKWAMPAIQIPAGAFLVVFASGIEQEDHPENWPYRDQRGYYHTNFTLDAEGEYLALVAPGPQIAHEYASYAGGRDAYGFPPQRDDLSYGLYGDQEQYFTAQSPGRANSPGYPSVSDEPVFSRAAGTFYGYFLLELISPNPQAEIHWSLDGQIPTTAWPMYDGPIPIAGTREVLARAYEPGKAPSAVVSRTYIALANDVLNFSSNLPIVIVDTSRQGISTTFSRASSVVIDTGEQGRAKISDPPDFAGRAGVKKRGRSTGSQAKPQYAMEVWDENNRDKDAAILGMPADSDWVLYAPYTYDRALINNAFVYDLSNQMGRYGVRTRFVEMYVNVDNDTVSASDYVGLYIFMEKIKRGPERVNVEKLDPWDSTEPRISGGYMLKNDQVDPGDRGFRTARGNPTYGDGIFCYVDPKEVEITTAQSNWIKGYLDTFEDALYGPNFADPRDGYARYIDVDCFIDHNLLNMLAMNVDALRLSTYFYKPRGGRLGIGPVWDFDRALDSTDGRDNNAQSWHGTGDGTDYHRYVWWNRLFEDANFWQKYIDRWYALREGAFSTANLNATIDAMANEIREAQVRNQQKWPGQGPRFGSFQGEIDHLKQWLETRCTWVDGQFVTPPQILPAGGHVPVGAVVSLASSYPSGTLFYTLDGSDPRPSSTVTITRESTTLVAEDAPKRAIVPAAPIDDAWRGGSAFDDSAWISGTGGVGYERQSGYQQYFGIDLGDQMYNRNTSCYIRIPFTVPAEPGTFNFMTLRMRYDDGFIAYLNDVEIQRALFNGTPAWNSAASSNHDDGAAVIFEDFDVSAQVGLLREGQNMLAIHGLNSSTTSSDLLFSAELVAGRSTSIVDSNDSGDIHQYSAPFPITQSCRIKARVLVSNNAYSPWSGLAQTVVAVGPVAESLRISEIMYHPLDPNTEFVELTNIGGQTINLNLVAFTNGVEFTFPSVELAPAEHVLVVEDVAAFEAAYGPGLPIAGVYNGNLSNSGERIELQDAAGQIIHSFRFEDDWYAVTDGDGFSLTLRDPAATDPDTLGQRSVWRPSTDPGGSPGFKDAE
ncbi:MAG: CotH kinase family protein [Sedimentisphaerales bacterium]|nr:CotH kinase family protein [Sedimentisphaerales bacterium]